LLARRRACSTPIRVARVSRLIGISDTTAKRSGWQVYFSGTGMGTNPCNQPGGRTGGQTESPPKAALTHETPLQSERRFGVLHRPLASRSIAAGGFFHRTYCRFPQPVYPFSGPLLWRLLLPGICCSWLAENCGSRYITGTCLIAIGRPFETVFIFNKLCRISGCDCLDSGSKTEK
jgi:hypothetical protein